MSVHFSHHRVRRVVPVILTPISPYFPITSLPDPTYPSLPPSLPPSLQGRLDV